ncbi:MAG: motility-associated protein, partial [Pseudomonadota bacterium]
MAVVFGFIFGLVAMLGGFVAMDGKLSVLWQPFEFVIIFGIAIGIFVMA